MPNTSQHPTPNTQHPLHVAVIGAGAMGRNHLRVLNDLEADVVGVADADLATAQRVARRYGGIAAYDDYREMLDKEKPQAVVIAVPTVLHCEVALEALTRG